MAKRLGSGRAFNDPNDRVGASADYPLQGRERPCRPKEAYIPYFVRDFPRLDPRGREGREGLEGFEKRHGILDGASGLWRTSAAGGGSWRMA